MKLTITGDSLFSSTNLVNRLPKQITEQLLASDVAFTNAEFSTPAITTAPGAGRGYVTAVRPNRLIELKNLHFNLINFANNHTGDFGVTGILDTIHSIEQLGLEPVGLGRSLFDARKPRFIDTPEGRVSIVAASSTRAAVFLASAPGNSVPARPGLNPLRWNSTYVLNETEFNQLKHINADLGTAASAEIAAKIERWDEPDANHFNFGSMFEEHLLIEKGDHSYVKTAPDADDLAAIEQQIRDAKYRSNFTIFSLHTHEGAAENWYSTQPADFVIQTAHAAIDAGADLVVGHGAHFLRGVEIYHGKQIYYNLGSFLMEFEAGESIIPPEMYAAYGIEDAKTPSTLHRGRAYDEEGKFAGFNADPLFSEGAILTLELNNGQLSTSLLPIYLQMDHDDATKRGLPVVATAAQSQATVEHLNEASAPFGTHFNYNAATDSIHID